MNKYVLIILCFICLSNKCENDLKKESKDCIPWSKEPLTWKDFKGKPDEKGEYDAKTFVTIAYEAVPSEYEFNVKVTNCFEPEFSWSRLKNKRDISQRLLKHEQLHFDIAELMTRKIRKELSNIQSNNYSLTNQVIKIIYDKYSSEELLNYNTLYDKQTDHGSIRTEQIKWERKVKNELYKYRKYEKEDIKIRRIKSLKNRSSE